MRFSLSCYGFYFSCRKSRRRRRGGSASFHSCFPRLSHPRALTIITIIIVISSSSSSISCAPTLPSQPPAARPAVTHVAAGGAVARWLRRRQPCRGRQYGEWQWKRQWGQGARVYLPHQPARRRRAFWLWLTKAGLSSLAAADDATVGSTLTNARGQSVTITRIVSTANAAIINPVTATGTILAADHGTPLLAASHPIWIAPMLLSSSVVRTVVNGALLASGDVATVGMGAAVVLAKFTTTLAVARIATKALRRTRSA